jgi:hypothetical protein
VPKSVMKATEIPQLDWLWLIQGSVRSTIQRTLDEGEEEACAPIEDKQRAALASRPLRSCAAT